MKTLLILALFFVSTWSIEFDHPCREDVNVKTNFLPAAYTGVWYEIQRTDDLGADCLMHHYTRNTNQDGFYVIRDGILDGVYYHEDGTALFQDPEPEDNILLARFNATLNRVDGELHEYTYQIVHSDYSNYAIVWSCENIDGGERSREEGAILGRTTSFSSRINNTITFLVGEMGFDRNDFRNIDQSFETCILEQKKRGDN